MILPAKLVINGDMPKTSSEKLSEAINNYWFEMVGVSVDIFNSHIEAWNQEYERLGLPLSGDDYSEYDEWLVGKMALVAETINHLAPKNDLIKRYFYEPDVRLSVELCNGTTIAYEIDWDTSKKLGMVDENGQPFNKVTEKQEK